MHELAGAYALDALSDEERRFFTRHLDECAACRQEVDELHATAALLGGETEQTPPPGMRNRVLAQVAATPQVRNEPPAHAPATGPSSAPAAPAGPAPASTPVARPQRPNRLRQLLPAVAAVVALAVAGLTVLSVRTGPSVIPTDEQLAAVVAAPDARMIDLDAPEGIVARFVWSGQRGEGVLVTDGLEAPPEGQAYALWVIDGESPVLAGMFAPDERGYASHAVDEALAGAGAVAVTVEQADGVDAPTSEPFIQGAL